MKLTRDPEYARDLYQETVCRAIANSGKFNEGTNLAAWLQTIMHNIFVNEYRKKKRWKYIQKEYFLTAAGKYAVNAGYHGLSMKEIQAAVRELPVNLYRAFSLFLAGYSYQEIAVQVNIPLGTVKNRIHRARKHLQQVIRESRQFYNRQAV